MYDKIFFYINAGARNGDLKIMKIQIHYRSETPVGMQKTILGFLLSVAEGAWEKDVHEITWAEIKKKLSHHDKDGLWHALYALVGTIVEFDWEEDKFSGTSCGILCLAKNDKGKVSFGFSREFVRLMQDPEALAYVKQLISGKLRSRYAINLYQYCLGYYKNPGAVNLTPFIGLADLRKKLGCENEKSYSQYSEFNRAVIKGAISKINQATELRVQVSAYQRNANSITAIRLSVVSKDAYLKRTAAIGKSTKNATTTLDEIINEYEDAGGGKE